MVKTYNIAMIVIEEETDRLNGIASLNKNNMECFKGYCEAIDDFVQYSEAQSVSVDINEKTHEVIVSIELDEVIIEHTQAEYLALVESAVSVAFSKGKDDSVEMTLVFPTLWDNNKR